MDSSGRSEENNEETTKSRPVKSSIMQTKEKPALSPIEEETDSLDSSGDSAVNFHDIENISTTKNGRYDLRVSLGNDYEKIIGDLGEETPRNERRRDESPPFLTARNTSDLEGKYRESSATTSYGRNSEDDDEQGEEDSSLVGESTSGEVDDYYYYEEDYDGNGLDAAENDDLVIVADEAEESGGNLLVSSRKTRANRRPKSAPSCSFLEQSSDASRDEKLGEITTTLDWLKARIVKSERDIFDLRKQLIVEKIRGRKLTRRYEDDRNVTRESLRIDLELWIKKLNDGLRGYLAEWQKRERLRLNEEISRISDLYSQEIANSLRISLKEWLTEDTKNIYEVIETRDKTRENNERVSARVVYDKIHAQLENLEKRNRKSYASLCKQIDKWEDRLRNEIVKIHEEDLRKLRQQVNKWYEDGQVRRDESSNDRQMSKEQCTEMKRSSSFLGAEALLQVEENLMKRLRDSSSKDLRRTEQIVRTELKTQRRELAKRMNDKIGELWMAFEEFGCSQSFLDRRRSRIRTEVDESRGGVVGYRSKDPLPKPDVPGGRWIGGKILGSNRLGGSSVSNSDVDEDGDRDYGEDDTTGESSERNKNIIETPIFSPTLPESSSTYRRNSFINHSTERGEK